MAAKGSRSPYRREFVLPDGVSNFRGYVRVSLHPMRALFHAHSHQSCALALQPGLLAVSVL
eukprot:1161006-Pelagomonas_calceolata.AAC.5